MNHESILDIIWFVSVLPKKIRQRTFMMGKRELVKNPFLRFLFNRMNIIEVDREGKVLETLALSKNILNAGLNLFVYPEGTRSRNGKMQPFKAGIGKLMIDSNALIVPCAVKGSFDLWKPDMFFPKRKNEGITAFLKIGEPMNLQDLKKKKLVPSKPTAISITKAVRKIIVSMRGGE
jgi:long-chain acyl-CoA synthetase